MLNSKKIEVLIDSQVKNIINTDVERFKQLLVFLLNKIVPKMVFGKIHFKVNPGSVQNDMKIWLEFDGEIDFFEICHSCIVKSKIKRCSSPFLSSKGKENYPDSEFSIIDYLVLCLSIGKNEFLETKIKNSSENMGCLSNISYGFEIHDVKQYETIKLKDPFKEKNNFKLKFEKLEVSIPEVKDKYAYVTKDEIVYKTNSRSNTSISENVAKQTLVKNVINQIYDISNKTSTIYSNFLVLNVDDISFSLMVISNYCNSQKLPFREAKNGLEALKVVESLYFDQKKKFDLIFMDLDMPIMNGFEGSKKINEFYKNNILPPPIILAISANVTNEEILADCQNSGMTELIQKPMSAEKFQELLDKYLKK